MTREEELLDEIVARFGVPVIQYFGNDSDPMKSWNVMLPLWHIHGTGMAYSPLAGQGDTLEEAARALLRCTDDPALRVCSSSDCYT